MFKIKLFSTNMLPPIGGSAGALTQIKNIIDLMPSVDVIISTIIIAAIGAVVGYIVKMGLDYLFAKFKK